MAGGFQGEEQQQQEAREEWEEETLVGEEPERQQGGQSSEEGAPTASPAEDQAARGAENAQLLDTVVRDARDLARRRRRTGASSQ